MLKVIALSFALSALASFGAASAEQVKVGISAEPYPPFASPDASGDWTGWEIDFQKALCAEAKLDCVLTPVSWDGIIPSLTSGRIDIIMSSMGITEARKQTIDFSDKYFNVPSAVIGVKGAAFDATPEGLSGKSLGVQVSSIHQAYAAKYFADSDIREYQTQDEAMQDLVAGRIDAVQADGTSLDAFLKTSDGKECCDKKGAVKDDPAILGAGVGIGLRKGDDALKEKLNAAIKTLRANGTYAEITSKYFDFDIYGQ